MNQPALFSDVPAIDMSVSPVQTFGREPAERQRLSRQCQAILERLRMGPASNRDLAQIALKYTGRLSEIKDAGYRVACYDQNRVTGLAWYRLEA